MILYKRVNRLAQTLKRVDNTMKTMKKNACRAAATLAFAGVVMAGGSGVASAGADDVTYPLTPATTDVDTDTSPSEPVATTPDTAVSPSGSDDSPEGGATLPQTGGPGTTQILLIAGAAVAAGVAVTGFAARRRDDALTAA